MHAMLNKRTQYERAQAAGVQIPATYFPASAAEAEVVAANIQYPCLFKPFESALGRVAMRSATGRPEIRREGADRAQPGRLVDWFTRVADADIGFMAQEIVPGGDETLFGYWAFWDHDGEERYWMTKRKVRQFPLDFGSGSMMDSVVAPEVAELSRTLLGSFGYRGMANIEFKFDARDGSYRLIEINPRSSGALQLAVSAGIDFPVLLYDYLARRPERTAGPRSFRPGVRWVYEDLDLQAFLALRKQGDLTLRRWVRSVARHALVGGRGAERSDPLSLPNRGVPARSGSQGRPRPIPQLVGFPARCECSTCNGRRASADRSDISSRCCPRCRLPASMYACACSRLPAGNDSSNALRAAGVDTTVKSAGPDVNPLAVTGLVGEIRRFRPDLVHTHLVHADVHGQLAASVARVVGISSVHGTPEFYGREPYRSAGRMVGRLARRRIAISEYVADFIRRARLAPPDRIRVVPYGIDARLLEGGAESRSDDRAALDLHDSDFAIGIASRLIPGKGHDVLIEAVAAAARESSAVKLLVAGDGPDAPGSRTWPDGSAPRHGAVPGIRGGHRAVHALVRRAGVPDAAGAERGIRARRARSDGRRPTGDRVSRGVAAGSGRRRRSRV